MILGAMTIAMLLALILFTSLFSDSFPRNFTRYLETKIATFSLDYKCNYMWRFSVWSLRTRNFDLQSQYTWSEIHFSLCQSRLECEELITITNISHMDTLWKRDWEELQHLATLVLHGINRLFQLVHFVFPFRTTWCPHGNFPFVFSLVMRKFARA